MKYSIALILAAIANGCASQGDSPSYSADACPQLQPIENLAGWEVVPHAEFSARYAGNRIVVEARSTRSRGTDARIARARTLEYPPLVMVYRQTTVQGTTEMEGFTVCGSFPADGEKIDKIRVHDTQHQVHEIEVKGIPGRK